MSTTIDSDSASGIRTQSDNPPMEPSSDDSVAGAQYLQAPDSSAPTTIQMVNPGLDSGKATVVGSVLGRQDNMEVVSDSDTNDQLTGLDELFLYETDEEDMKMISPKSVGRERETGSETVAIGAAEETKASGIDLQGTDRKREAGYRRSLRYLRQLDRRDPSTLSAREKRLKRKHEFHVRMYESKMNTTVVEVRPPGEGQGQSKAVTTSGKTEAHGHSDARKTDHAVPRGSGPNTTVQPKLLTDAPSTSRGTSVGTKAGGGRVFVSKPGGAESKGSLAPISLCSGAKVTDKAASRSIGKRQRSGETQVSEGKRLKPSASLSSAPELQVAIIDRTHPEGRMSADRWLLLEERILRALVDALARSEDDSFTAFDGAKWQKGVKIVGCGNEKALNFLKDCIQQFDNLWPGMKVDIVPMDQIPYQTTVKVWIPPPVIEDEAILTLMKRQNKGLGSDDWRIIRGRARDKGDGKDLWIKVNSESLRLLRLSEGRVKFGLNHLRMILPRGGTSNES